MQYSVFILIGSFLIFLFMLYALSRNDYIFLKKDLSLEKLFDLAIAVMAIALFSARLFYVLLNPSIKFINPLVFFLFPYSPGLSFAGGIIGGVCALVLLSKIKKLPWERLLDFFTLSFLISTPFAAAAYMLAAGGNLLSIDFILLAVFLLIVIFLVLKFYLADLMSGRTSAGALGLAILNFIALFEFLINFVHKSFDALFFIIFLATLFLFVKREKLHRKIKQRLF